MKASMYVAATVLAFVATPAEAQVTIFFDNGGAEAGITEPGARPFSFMGSDWQGGVVATEGVPPLYASGAFSYEIEEGGGSVAFDVPVDSARFFFVHGFGFAAGDATARDAQGQVLASAGSRAASRFGDAANFVTLDPETAIASIDFSAGVIDNFSFTELQTTPSPSPTRTPTAAPTATDTVTTMPTATDTPTPVDTATPTNTLGPIPCVGDCDDDGRIAISELVRGVNIALGNADLGDCPAFDDDGNETVAIDELIAAVNAALRGCDPQI